MKRAVLFFGNTCTGKSTLGKEIEKMLGFRYISFGDLIRREIAQDSRIGKALDSKIRSGGPINPRIGALLMNQSLDNGNLNIISGYPISVEELESFTLFCRSSIEGIVVFEASNSVIKERFFSRGTCSACQFSGKKGKTCPEHNIQLVERPGSTIGELLFRMRLYKERIAPFLGSEELKVFPRLVLKTSHRSIAKLALDAMEWLSRI